ncbi:hypothetical protein AABB24_019603, partial [Solanum stoloniferum]
MLFHISASLSHTSSSTTAFFLSSTAKFLRPRFSFFPKPPFQFPIHQKRHRFVFSQSTAASMDSAATVDSVADDLKKQNLEGIEIKLKLNLEELNWDNSFVRELPGDPRSDSIPREVLHACYTKVLPSVPVNNPQLVALSESVAELLELDPREIPYAQNYGGHQFGMWAGQLGDGRAITLGEILNSKSQRWELQLKGAGKTPYSRFADGLAVLRSSIREFLCSEAMHGLGIPTTRALCLVMTGKDVMRDMFY